MTNECEIPRCGRTRKAGGLCAMHYMRQRRTGENETRTPGRPPDPRRAWLLAQLGSGLSARSFARFNSAWWTIHDLEPNRQWDDLKLCLRPNGTINVAEFERCAMQALLRWAESPNFPEAPSVADRPGPVGQSPDDRF